MQEMTLVNKILKGHYDVVFIRYKILLKSFSLKSFFLSKLLVQRVIKDDVKCDGLLTILVYANFAKINGYVLNFILANSRETNSYYGPIVYTGPIYISI